MSPPEAVESNEDAPQTLFLQMRQAQSPQPLLTGHFFQPFYFLFPAPQRLSARSMGCVEQLALSLLCSQVNGEVCAPRDLTFAPTAAVFCTSNLAN